ncbi:MAG: hypothetical protein K2J76_04555, partial [Oscillospiraceae bacterium]|nr:hypothetical protein [Oscillospiraceae bacterium]
MNLKTKLGGAVGILFIGVFYMFAFCMVDDVEEKTIPIEYYYSAEYSETGAFEQDFVSGGAVDDKSETETVKSEEVRKELDFDDISDDENNPEHIEAVPAMVSFTEADKNAESREAPAETEKPADE